MKIEFLTEMSHEWCWAGRQSWHDEMKLWKYIVTLVESDKNMSILFKMLFAMILDDYCNFLLAGDTNVFLNCSLGTQGCECSCLLVFLLC